MDSARDRLRQTGPLVAHGTEAEAREVITASAQLLRGTGRETYAITYRSWQDELWAYRKSVGEYASVMNWFAAGFGRIHLRAGIWKPGVKEPEILKTGRAAELVQELTLNAEGGETQFMRTWALHLGIAGVGFFVAEETDIGRIFDVKSADVIKRSGKPLIDPETGKAMIDKVTKKPVFSYDIQTAPDEWRTLGIDSLVGRIFDPDPQYDYMPTSMTQAALTTLREIDLINRAIVATLLSRVAFNGILLIPEEVTFPVNPQFKDAADPFIAELLHFAGRGIKDPGSPGAAIPFPLRVNSAFIEKFKHLLLASGLDPKIIEARDSAVKRLSEQLPAPPEAMTGVGDMNHWSAWQASEDNVKFYFGPQAEILCGGLTKVYLRPMLKAAGESLRDKDGNRIVVWYDASDLTKDPDNSDNATAAKDRIVIKDESYRATLGFDEDDKPNDEEERRQILVGLAAKGTPLPDSYFLLYPKDRAALDKIMPPPPELQTPGGAGNPAAGPSGKTASSGDNKGTPPKKQPTPGAPK